MKRGKRVRLDPPLLKREIEMQTEALKRIGTWIKIALIISSFGVLLTYYAYNYNDNNFLRIGGFILIALGLGAAIFFGYGQHKGRKNVHRMIDELEKMTKK